MQYTRTTLKVFPWVVVLTFIQVSNGHNLFYPNPVFQHELQASSSSQNSSSQSSSSSSNSSSSSSSNESSGFIGGLVIGQENVGSRRLDLSSNHMDNQVNEQNNSSNGATIGNNTINNEDGRATVTQKSVDAASNIKSDTSSLNVNTHEAILDTIATAGQGSVEASSNVKSDASSSSLNINEANRGDAQGLIEVTVKSDGSQELSSNMKNPISLNINEQQLTSDGVKVDSKEVKYSCDDHSNKPNGAATVTQDNIVSAQIKQEQHNTQTNTPEQQHSLITSKQIAGKALDHSQQSVEQTKADGISKKDNSQKIDNQSQQSSSSENTAQNNNSSNASEMANTQFEAKSGTFSGPNGLQGGWGYFGPVGSVKSTSKEMSKNSSSSQSSSESKSSNSSESSNHSGVFNNNGILGSLGGGWLQGPQFAKISPNPQNTNPLGQSPGSFQQPNFFGGFGNAFNSFSNGFRNVFNGFNNFGQQQHESHKSESSSSSKENKESSSSSQSEKLMATAAAP